MISAEAIPPTLVGRYPRHAGFEVLSTVILFRVYVKVHGVAALLLTAPTHVNTLNSSLIPSDLVCHAGRDGGMFVAWAWTCDLSHIKIKLGS